MISDTEVRHLEEAITRMRADFMKLVKDETIARDRANKATRRIQMDLERDLDMYERKRRELEREIAHQEQDLNRRRSEQNRTGTTKR